MTDKYNRSLIPQTSLFGTTLVKNFHIYEKIQDSIGPIHGCGSYLHGGFSKNYSLEYFEKQSSLFHLISGITKYFTKCKVLEIGVFDGSSGLIMLLANKKRDMEIFGIDICENYYPETSINILNTYFENRYHLIKGSSSEVINDFKLGTKFEIIHIDANHSFQNVSQDILNCIRFSTKDTYWIFDDTDNEGVIRALEFHKEKFNLVRSIGNHSIFTLNPKFLVDETKKLPTIVVQLFNIKNFRDMDFYLKHGKPLLELEIPMIINTEESLVEEIMRFRPAHLADITKYNITELEKSSYYGNAGKLKENMDKYKIENLNPDKDTPLYFIVNNNKFDCISRAINENPHKSTHFIYMDFGISYNTKSVNQIRRWIYSIPNKIRQMEINPYIDSDHPKDYFKIIRHNLAGSLFSGDIDHLRIYCKLFNRKWNQVLEENWCQLDEAIMTLVARESPALFDHYYGDYQSLISGYDSYFDSDVARIIFNSIYKCINLNSPAKAYLILEYLKPYFNHNEHYLNLREVILS
jgi:hypothetical protein